MIIGKDRSLSFKPLGGFSKPILTLAVWANGMNKNLSKNI